MSSAHFGKWQVGANDQLHGRRVAILPKKKGRINQVTKLKEVIGVNNWAKLKAFVEGPGIKKLVEGLMKMNKVSYLFAFISLLEFLMPQTR